MDNFPLATFVTEYTETPVRELVVMKRDARGHGLYAGTAAKWFGDEVASLQVGPSQGVDTRRGAYDWWPLLLGSKTVAELRDDANGMTIHVEDGI